MKSRDTAKPLNLLFNPIHFDCLLTFTPLIKRHVSETTTWAVSLFSFTDYISWNDITAHIKKYFWSQTELNIFHLHMINIVAVRMY